MLFESKELYNIFRIYKNEGKVAEEAGLNF